MLRGFLNEIKNTAINRATSRVNNMISDALGGGRSNGLPRNSGRLDRSNYAKVNPFQGETIAYPEDLGSADQGHYIIFNINEQANANTITGSQTVCFNGPVSSLNGSTVTGSPTITYQWQSRTNTDTFSDIFGAVGINYTPSGLSSTTAFTDFSDVTYSSASFTANGAMIYNTTTNGGSSTTDAVCIIAFGGDKTASNGTFKIEFPTADASSAIIRLA